MKYLDKFSKFNEAKSADDLVDIFKISTKIEDQIYNGYAISSLKTEKTIINFLISAAKNKFIKNEYLFKEDSFGDGYLYSYMIYLILSSIKNNPELNKDSRKLISEVSKNFEVSKLNKEKVSRLEAEKLKRELISKDPDSFKTKGAAVKGSNFYRLLKSEMEGKVKATGSTSELLKLFEGDFIQYYPKDEEMGDEFDWIVYHNSAVKIILDNLKKLDSGLSEGKEKFSDEFLKHHENKEAKKLDKKLWEQGLRSIPYGTRIYNLFSGVAKKGGFDSSDDR
jgi:hypothetical protein